MPSRRVFRRLSPLLLALPLAALVATAASAQRGPGRRGPGQKHARLSEKERKELREEVKRKVQTYVTVELSSLLGLDDATTLKLSAVIKEQMSAREQAQQALKAEAKKLQELLDANAPDKKIRAQTQVVMEKAKARKDPAALFEKTARFLSTKQQAKLVLAYPKLTREVRQLMQKQRRRMRKQHRGKRGGPGPQGG